jgi:hypothetical protein
MPMTRILIAYDSPPVRHGLRNLLKGHADWEVLWGSRRRAGRDCKDPALGSRRHCDGLRDAYYRRYRSGTENIERGSNHFNPTFFDVHGLPACHSGTPRWYLSSAVEATRDRL